MDVRSDLGEKENNGLTKKEVWWGEHRGIRYEINRFDVRYNDKECWTFYLHLIDAMFKEEDRKGCLLGGSGDQRRV